ncbi:hypothetical protein C1I98_19610 [Spongiactinospora gelatinilytica]|uniref:SH3 domain-containing protein n=1 Tax=Spongiactinospora gelatinilytica TaxID=2666298 RepID=A0A2W2G3V3_9ACTN|nr:hypothetical protein [Spongiactinospora gelatinilytica]PZG42612.1 hypothetical protein C1I98_19610 [Spongiactinospora gelatinilytica]
MKIARPRGDRATAVVAAAIVGALVVAAAVFGVGVSSANPRLADVGAWSVDLAYPTQSYKNANNGTTDSLIQCGPQGGCEVGKIPKGEYRSLTVICQTKGKTITDNEQGGTSDVWNRIEWNGGVAYISDTLMATPKGGLPAAPLFQCED